MSSTSEALARVADALAHSGVLTVLTGAGVSAQRAAASGALLIDVNPNANPFATLAARSGGVVLRAQATDALPELATQVARHVT